MRSGRPGRRRVIVHGGAAWRPDLETETIRVRVQDRPTRAGIGGNTMARYFRSGCVLFTRIAFSLPSPWHESGGLWLVGRGA